MTRASHTTATAVILALVGEAVIEQLAASRGREESTVLSRLTSGTGSSKSNLVASRTQPSAKRSARLA